MAHEATYEDSVEQARSQDPDIRARVAERDDVPPELLFFLANDPNSAVRFSIAANPKTPSKADLLLASDQDIKVRGRLAKKVAELLPHLDEVELQAAEHRLLEALELLARDQAAQVRRILAETLKDKSPIPESVIRSLAHDNDDLVALPILEFSPLLDDAELISIIEDNCGLQRLCAISRRNNLGADVSDAIVARGHEPAITELLENQSAQIRENTLDALVDRAAKVADWHAPLVKRPSLPSQTVRKLSGIVAGNLLEKLLERSDLDQDTEAAIRQEVSARLDREQSHDSESQGGQTSDGETPKGQNPDGEPVEDGPLKPNSRLTAEQLQEAVAAGDRDAIRVNLIARSKLKAEVVDRILDSQSAMALTALSWKSGLTMDFAVQLQLRIGGVAPDDLLKAKKGGICPMTPSEMNWQIEMFGADYPRMPRKRSTG